MVDKEIRANKRDVLNLIKRKEVVEASDLVSEFGYTVKSARTRLYRLNKGGLVEKLGTRRGAYCLTPEAYRRLDYYGRRE